jgi:hypothetical protein
MNTEISEARKCAEELGPLTLSSWSTQKTLMLPVMEEIIQKYMDANRIEIGEAARKCYAEMESFGNVQNRIRIIQKYMDSEHARLKAQNDDLSTQLEDTIRFYKDKLPTTAQIMVYEALLEKYKTLEAQNEALVKDKQRLDWLIREVQFVDRRFPTPDQSREAIDAAIAKEREKV